jgi:predicted O-methyltransferase YrrM
MKALDLIAAKGFTDAQGVFTPLHSSVTGVEVAYLRELIAQCRPSRTLEVGCAQGISSLAICECIGPEARHTIIDAFQSTDWKDHGLHNLRSAGFSNFTLIEQRSEFALPRLCEEGCSFDFAFVDGWHTLDHVMVEFFYIDRMLPIGGIVAFDDTSLIGLNRLMRYITRYPGYTCLGSRGDLDLTTGRRLLHALRSIVGALTLPLGARLRGELLNDTVVRPDRRIGLQGSMTAFRKSAEDSRGWAWYEAF